MSRLQLCVCLRAVPLQSFLQQGLASRALLSVCIVQEEQALKSKMGKQTGKKKKAEKKALAKQQTVLIRSEGEAVMHQHQAPKSCCRRILNSA